VSQLKAISMWLMWYPGDKGDTASTELQRPIASCNESGLSLSNSKPVTISVIKESKKLKEIC